MSISINSAAIANASPSGIDSAQLARVVATINASIADNSNKIFTNSVAIAANAAKAIATDNAILMLSSELNTIAMASTNPAFFETLQASITANSNAISTAISNANLPDLN